MRRGMCCSSFRPCGCTSAFRFPETNRSRPAMNLNLDDELIQDYLAECLEHLARIENDLLAIEQAGADIDEQVVNQVFRAAHSIKGGAGFFGLNKNRRSE